MKNVVKYIAIFGAAGVLFTSCIKEEFPTQYVNSAQIGGSASGLEAAVAASNAWLTESMSVLSSHGDFGYPGICMGLDALTSDVACGPEFGYDAEFLRWRACSTISADGNAPYFIWKFFYTLVMNANDVIKTIDLESATSQQKIYVAQAKVYRAMSYLYLSRVFEYKGTETGAFVGLTVPLITEHTTEEMAQNNPRIPHEEMYAFIEAELLEAVDMLAGYNRPGKNQINQSVAYGMLARLYLADNAWAKAEAAARNAIQTSGCRLMTEAEWHDPKSGFNNIDNPSWMWGIKISSDDRVVTTGICNFVSFMSPESTYGYVSAGGYQSVKQIDKNLYERIPDTDWRKKSWLDPDRSKFNYQYNLPAEIYASIPDYAPLKFRPGQGETGDYMTGSAADFPVMRVEEMYLIEAEAAAMQDASRGKALLEAFALTRNPNFFTTASTSTDLQDAILFQRQIELWGEGLTMFELKRLDKPQLRGYTGTNHFAGSRYNSPDGTAVWTTLPLPTLELNSNSALSSQQNPNPQTRRGTEWVED